MVTIRGYMYNTTWKQGGKADTYENELLFRSISSAKLNEWKMDIEANYIEKQPNSIQRQANQYTNISCGGRVINEWI